MVASEEIETHRTLYPRTTVRWHAVDGAVAAARRLLDDAAFAATVRAEARTAVDYYALPQARARLEDAVAIIRDRRRLREGA
jgi:hypothetical protein